MRILIVEDDQRVADQFTKMLRLFGHEVLSATTAAGGRDLFGHHEFDLIVADHGLPDNESGAEFLRWVALRRPDMRCVLISGVGCPLEFVSAPPLRIFVAKPFNVREFLSIVESSQTP